MYVNHLQEYLSKFTEGNNGRQGNAVSDAKIYIMTSKGYLEEIKRIEVHESTNLFPRQLSKAAFQGSFPRQLSKAAF